MDCYYYWFQCFHFNLAIHFKGMKIKTGHPMTDKGILLFGIMIGLPVAMPTVSRKSKPGGSSHWSDGVTQSRARRRQLRSVPGKGIV